MLQIPGSWAARLPPALRRLLFADPGQELLRGVDASVLLFGDRMLHVETGNSAAYQPGERTTAAETIAACARGLLGTGKERSILLLLPPGEFAATPVEMPGVSGDNLRSAVLLQAESTLPAMEEPLELAVHSSEDGPQIILWMRSGQLHALHRAFAAEGLFLAAVKPRILHSQAANAGIVDSDGASFTFAHSAAGALRQWKHVEAEDLAQEAFAQQWEAELRAATGAAPPRVESLVECATALDREAHSDYSFFPAEAMAICRRREQRRQFLRGAAAVGVVALLGAIPFILQQIESGSLNRQLESRRELSAPARADREVVVDFENRWGALNDFPDQTVRDALFALQSVLSPNRLSDLEITEGIIRIQGASEDPQSILQRLEQDPMFSDVTISRAISNDQYYIDLRLTEVNFEAYMARYFPDR